MDTDFITQLVLELRGRVDPRRLRRAAQVLLDRHGEYPSQRP